MEFRGSFAKEMICGFGWVGPWSGQSLPSSFLASVPHPPKNVEFHGWSLIYPWRNPLSPISAWTFLQDLQKMLARFLKDKYHASYDPAETPKASSWRVPSGDVNSFANWKIIIEMTWVFPLMVDLSIVIWNYWRVKKGERPELTLISLFYDFYATVLGVIWETILGL